MATRKWSSFPTQDPLLATDELMLLDSTDATPADRDKKAVIGTVQDFIQQNFTKVVVVSTATFTVDADDHFALIIIGPLAPPTVTITLDPGSTLFKGFTVTVKQSNNDIAIKGIILPSATNQIDFFDNSAVGLNESVTYQLEDGTDTANWSSISTSGLGQDFGNIRNTNIDTYTVAEDDNGFNIVFPTSGTAKSLILPTNVVANVRKGFWFNVYNPGTGKLTVTSSDLIEGTPELFGVGYLKIFKRVFGIPNVWVISSSPDPLLLTTVERDALVSPTTGLNIYNTTQTQLNNFDGTDYFTPTQKWVRRATAVSTITTVDDSIIGVTDTTIARTVTLATATLTDGRIFIVKDESGAAGTNNITVEAAGGATINGVSSLDITVDFGELTVYSDGTNWFTMQTLTPQEGLQTANWSGIWAGSVSGDIEFQIDKEYVSLVFPPTFDTATTVNVITLDTALPAFLRPLHAVHHPLSGADNAVTTELWCAINSNGTIKIGIGVGAGTFTGSGSSGFFSLSITYLRQ